MIKVVNTVAILIIPISFNGSSTRDGEAHDYKAAWLGDENAAKKVAPKVLISRWSDPLRHLFVDGFN